MLVPEKYLAFDFLLEGIQIVDNLDRYLYLNAAAARHAKRKKEDLLGSLMSQQFPGIENTPLYELLQDCRKKKESREMVNEFVYPDTTVGFFKIRMQPLPEGVLIMSIDISEIKNEELKISRAQSQNIATITNLQKAILDNTTDGIVLIGTDHKVLVVNNQMQRELLKYFKKEVQIGDDYRDFLIDARVQMYLDAFALAVKGQTVEIEDQTVEGEVSIWYRYKVNPVYDHQNEILGVALTATNIDLRKRREIELHHNKEKLERLTVDLRKYNHELILLTKINDIILSAKDEEALYDDVCECIVLSGEYKLAWICFKPQNKTLTRVDPTAAYGVTEYLKGIEIDLADPILSKGPTATVLNTGITVVNNNVSRQPYFVPWLERAKQFDISASIVLPIELLNGEIGALNIYSNAVEPFNESEVAILKRIAGNLSLAVKNLRTEQERSRAKHQLNERVKELSTIYRTHNILQDDEQSADDVLAQIVSILPSGWQYPEICKARIEFNGKTYETGDFSSVISSQRTEINIQDGRRGTIEIIYTQSCPPAFEGPFLEEERDLLNTIAKTIEVYFNKKSNQDNLLKSESLFRSVFEFSAIGMAVVSLKGDWLMVNEAISNFLGYTKEELRKKTFQALTYPEDLAKDLHYADKAKNGEIDSYSVEKRYIHKNGTLVWGNLNVSIVKDLQGKPLYFVSQIENITERIESQKKFYDLVEKSTVGVYIYQHDHFVYSNPEIQSELGYTEAEVEALTLEDFVYEEDLPIARSNIRARLAGKTGMLRYEIRIKKKDRSLLWVEIFGSMTIFHGEPAIIGTIVNISQKKAAFESLKSSEANLKSIFNNAPALIMLLDRFGNVIMVNNMLIEHYKILANHELKIGDTFIETASENRRTYLKGILKDLATTKQPFHYEYKYENSETYFSAVWSPVVSEDVVIGFLYFGFDISQRKQLEIERQKIVADLVKRNNELQDFGQMASHNLRGPLATIIGLTDMLPKISDENERAYIIKGVGDSVKLLDTVVREMNELLNTKDETQEGKTVIILQDLLQEIKQNLKQDIDSCKATIQFDFENKKELMSIRKYLRIILTNLLLNSFKFRDPSRSLEIDIWSDTSVGSTKLFIRDNGIGIDLNKHRHEMFQLNKKFNQRSQGRGMGLFMAKVCVEILNGQIDVESSPGEGSTFIITLPN